MVTFAKIEEPQPTAADARAFALWTGTTPPIHAMQRALDSTLDGM